ncbi:MAG: glycosyltransferase family 2 protein [Candidatus Bathyarchaeota archaeon]|nr:glycosyltransferase family 2 protein [Candidatus Bathyarchaeota archaeon]
MNAVDVVLLTKNSERVLEKCLISVYQNVPVKRLIVVDGGSTDRTLDILNKFNEKHHNVTVVFDGGTRATARQKGIMLVRTEWFMFVDSDVVLCSDWYKKALKQVTPDVGAVWGIEVWSTLRNRATLKLFLWLTRKIFEIRGGTHDTLTRTSAVADIAIPPNLHVFEDAYIKDWITKKDCRVIACYDPYCIHYRPESVWTFKGSLGLIAEAVRFGSFKLIAQLVPAYGFYTAYSLFQLLMNRSKRGGS